MKTWLLRLIKTQTTVSWIIYLLIFLYFLSLSKLISSEDRVNHSQLLTWYLLFSFSFLGICITGKNLSKNLIVSIAILSQLICFFYLPNLSTDYYRFLWDGELLNSGINQMRLLQSQKYQKDTRAFVFSSGLSLNHIKETRIVLVRQTNFFGSLLLFKAENFN